MVREVSTTNRKQGLESHVRALLQVLTGERAWMGKIVKEKLHEILTKEEEEMLMNAMDTPVYQKEVFMLEEQFENTKERQLLEELGDTLTQYAHLVARERLAKLRESQKRLEAEGKMEESLKLNDKEAEKLLQVVIKIEK